VGQDPAVAAAVDRQAAGRCPFAVGAGESSPSIKGSSASRESPLPAVAVAVASRSDLGVAETDVRGAPRAARQGPLCPRCKPSHHKQLDVMDAHTPEGYSGQVGPTVKRDRRASSISPTARKESPSTAVGSIRPSPLESRAPFLLRIVERTKTVPGGRPQWTVLKSEYASHPSGAGHELTYAPIRPSAPRSSLVALIHLRRCPLAPTAILNRISSPIVVVELLPVPWQQRGRSGSPSGASAAASRFQLGCSPANPCLIGVPSVRVLLERWIAVRFPGGDPG